MADENNEHEELPAWEPCTQCQTITGKEGIIEYSGAQDVHYLCCSSCKKYVHPTCDKISDHDGIFRYFCQTCRTNCNKKIAWKRKKPTRKNSLNQPIESPIPEITSNPENESILLNEKTKENENLEDTTKAPSKKDKRDSIDYPSTPEKSKNTNEERIDESLVTQTSLESQIMSASQVPEEISQEYDYLMDKIPSYQPQKTPEESPEKESELSGNITIEEVRDALVELIESQPESLRKQTKIQLNLDPNLKLTKSPSMPQPNFSPVKETPPSPTTKSNDATPNSPNLPSQESIPTHTTTITQPTQHPPIQCYPPNLEATMFTNVAPLMSTSTKSQPLQHRSKQEIISRYEKREKEYNQLQTKYEEQASKLKEMEEFKTKYEITLDALTITTKENMTPEERVTALQKDAVLNKEKMHKLEKRNEELKKENINKQTEIRKAKETTKSNMQVIHELQAYKEMSTGQIARLEELSKMKSDQITSLENLMGSQDIKIHNLTKQHSQKIIEIEENYRKTTIAMAWEIQKQKEAKERAENELNKLANKIMGKKPDENDEENDEIEIVQETNEPKVTCLYYRLGLCRKSNCQMKHSNGIELSPKEPSPLPKEPKENKANKICIHHRMGKCRRGEKCPFKHENKEDREECIYYKRGHCSRGSECKYKHKKEELTNIVHNQNHNTERRIPTQNDQREKPNRARCKEFDRGFCPLRSRCPLKHCKDRLNDETSSQREERSTPSRSHPPQENQTDQRNGRCADFDRGFCPRRNLCQLNHQKDRTYTARTAEERCRNFDRGYCSRGSSCRYIHRKDRLSMLPHQTNRQYQHRSRHHPMTETDQQPEQNYQRFESLPPTQRN